MYSKIFSHSFVGYYKTLGEMAKLGREAVIRGDILWTCIFIRDMVKGEAIPFLNREAVLLAFESGVAFLFPKSVNQYLNNTERLLYGVCRSEKVEIVEVMTLICSLEAKSFPNENIWLAPTKFHFEAQCIVSAMANRLRWLIRYSEHTFEDEKELIILGLHMNRSAELLTFFWVALLNSVPQWSHIFTPWAEIHVQMYDKHRYWGRDRCIVVTALMLAFRSPSGPIPEEYPEFNVNGLEEDEKVAPKPESIPDWKKTGYDFPYYGSRFNPIVSENNSSLSILAKNYHDIFHVVFPKNETHETQLKIYQSIFVRCNQSLSPRKRLIRELVFTNTSLSKAPIPTEYRNREIPIIPSVEDVPFLIYGCHPFCVGKQNMGQSRDLGWSGLEGIIAVYDLQENPGYLYNAWIKLTSIMTVLDPSGLIFHPIPATQIESRRFFIAQVHYGDIIFSLEYDVGYLRLAAIVLLCEIIGQSPPLPARIWKSRDGNNNGIFWWPNTTETVPSWALDENLSPYKLNLLNIWRSRLQGSEERQCMNIYQKILNYRNF
jgi:hypothetical protein